MILNCIKRPTSKALLSFLKMHRFSVKNKQVEIITYLSLKKCKIRVSGQVVICDSAPRKNLEIFLTSSHKDVISKRTVRHKNTKLRSFYKVCTQKSCLLVKGLNLLNYRLVHWSFMSLSLESGQPI